MMEKLENLPVILLVEDEFIVRATTQEMLEDCFEVLVADNSRQALKLLSQRGDIELLFTDINMPGMDGVDLACEVHRKHPDVRVILTSGRVLPRRAEIPERSVFLPKPYSYWQIHRLMCDLLGRPTQQ